MVDRQFDAMFSGIIGEEYATLKLICPLAAEMSRLVGESVAAYAQMHPAPSHRILEIGGGTGITTLTILMATKTSQLVSVDNEPNMQRQAKQSLQQWVEQGRLEFDSRDALSALKNTATASIDILASAYTLHNFMDIYRAEVIIEIYRVLKPGGQFINGDRYGLDDISAHTRTVQNEIAGYFKVLIEHNKLDVLL